MTAAATSLSPASAKFAIGIRGFFGLEGSCVGDDIHNIFVDAINVHFGSAGMAGISVGSNRRTSTKLFGLDVMIG